MFIKIHSVGILEFIRSFCCSVALSYPTFVTSGTAAQQASLSITTSQSLLNLVSIVSDAIRPFHPLSVPSPPGFNLSQHQGLFQWVSSSHQVAKVLELQLQHQLMNIRDWLPLGWTSFISMLSKGLLRVFSSTTVQRHQFFSALPSLLSSFHMCTWLLEKPKLWL